MDEIQVWSATICLASLFVIWLIGYDDGPNAHKKSPRKKGGKHNKK